MGLPSSAQEAFDGDAGFDLFADRDAGQELLLAPAIIIPLSMGLIFDSTNYFEIILL